jgi:predicted nucleotidyltransferase component of viral defense system
VDKPLTQKQLKELILVAGETLNIQYPSILEKDYYVTSTIHSLSDVENEYFRLIFAGGTCLAKAHRIVKRMSEDIDFKIQLKNKNGNFSKSRLLKELKKFRRQIVESLNLPNLTINDSVARNEGQYLRLELTYPALFAGDDIFQRLLPF